MMGKMPEQFDDVTVICKANIFFEGKVVSHTVLLKDGSKKTIGLMQPGTYKFNTDAPEKNGDHCREVPDKTWWIKTMAYLFGR